MAYAPLGVEPVLGEFVEKDYGMSFHYSENGDFGHGPFTRFPHLVWVGGLGQQYRYAEVKEHVRTVDCTPCFVDSSGLTRKVPEGRRNIATFRRHTRRFSFCDYI